MMYKLRAIILSAAFSVLSAGLSFGQATRTVSGEVEYFPPDGISIEQAEYRAIEHAKVQLIADEFGTLVGSVVSTTISNTDGKSVSNTFEVGESEVRGEWLETIGEPSVKREIRNGKELVMTVRIKGRIREIKNNFTEIEALALKNGATENCRSESFKTGDLLSILFRSSKSGYMNVYLVGENNMAQRLIPYGQNEGGSARVSANRVYVYFSPDDASQPNLNLFTDRDVEYNRLYVIFSSNDFSHPLDDISDDSYPGGYLPNSLPYDDFRSWLHKSRTRDSDMTVKIIDFSINGTKH